MECLVCGEQTWSNEENICSKSCAAEAEYRALDTSLPGPPKVPSDMKVTVGKKAPAPAERKAPAPAGRKDDGDKIPLHLLPFDSLIEIAKVLDFGAKKYEPNNWRKGIVYSRLFRATIGHLFSWWMGKDLDPETGLSHLAHAGCCIVFLLHYVTSGGTAAWAVLDDRKENNA
jgi:hypothetical protein